MIILEDLPYTKELLSPILSTETLDFHYNKHHKGYVDKLNSLIKGTDLENKNLQEIVITSYKENNITVYNNAAQIWNHDFYWKSLDPESSKSPSAGFLTLLESSFGNLMNFNNKFVEMGVTLFGSGWVWLVQDPKTLRLSITQTKNADNPLILKQTPILTIDVWEHAYYIDYRNNRVDYLKKVIGSLLNWKFAENNTVFN